MLIKTGLKKAQDFSNDIFLMNFDNYKWLLNEDFIL